MIKVILDTNVVVSALLNEDGLEAAIYEADNRFLECAEESQADFLVTGNIRHFPKRWKGTQVVTARQLIELVALRLKPR